MVQLNARFLCLLAGYLVWATSTSASAAAPDADLNGRSPLPEPFHPFYRPSTNSNPSPPAPAEGQAKRTNVKVDARDGKGVVVPLRKRARPPVRTGSLSAKELADLPATDLGGLRNLRETIQDKYSDRLADGGAKMRARRALEQEQIDKMEKKKKKKRTTQTLAMTNNNWDVTYSATMMLGTPAKPFEVILDTGSSDAWVTSNRCIGCSGGNSWDPTTSSTWKAREKVLTISYGSGNVAGRTGSDVVQMGGFTISDQVIGLVDQAGSILPGDTEGLMGLAFGRIAKSGGTPLWLRLAGGDASGSGGTLDSPLFSFWFSRYIDSTSTASTHPGGQFILGGTNSSLYTGDITYYPAAQPAQWWVIAMDGMSSGTSSAATDASTNRAIIDSGTTLIGGDESVLDAIFSQIPNAKKGDNVNTQLRGYYLLPCNATPSISLTFGGTSYPISPQDLLFQNIDDILPNYCISSFFVFSSSVAHSPDYTPAGQPYWLVGDAFLKNVYSVFSLGDGGSGQAGLNGMGNTGTTAQVGFAKLSGTDGQIGVAASSGSDSSGGSSGTPQASGSGTTGPHSAGTTLPMGIIPTGAGDAPSTTVVVVAPTDANGAASGAGYASVGRMGSTLVGLVVAGVAVVLAGSL